MKGYLDQTQNNLQSTKGEQQEEELPAEPMLEELNHVKINQAFAVFKEIGRVYSDQTGRFPITLSLGSKHVFLLYSYDANAIFTEPIKSRAGRDIVDAYTKIHKHLYKAGFTPKMHWLANEVSSLIKEYDKMHGIDYQLVPPQMYQWNAAERAI